LPPREELKKRGKQKRAGVGDHQRAVTTHAMRMSWLRVGSVATEVGACGHPWSRTRAADRWRTDKRVIGRRSGLGETWSIGEPVDRAITDDDLHRFFTV
jgi:hypothetical protein